MSIWLKLVPKLHMSGAEHVFPGHNIFHDNKDTYDQAGIWFGLVSLKIISNMNCLQALAQPKLIMLRVKVLFIQVINAISSFP